MDCSIKSIAKKASEALIRAYKSQRTRHYCYRLSRIVEKLCPDMTGRSYMLTARLILDILSSMGIKASLRSGAYLSNCLIQEKELNYMTAH